MSFAPYHSIPLPPHNLLVAADTRLVLDLGTCDLCPRHRTQVFDGYATIDPCNASLTLALAIQTILSSFLPR